MDQSALSARGGETAQGSTKKSAPGSGRALLGLIAAGLVLLIMAAVTLAVGR